MRRGPLAALLLADQGLTELESGGSGSDGTGGGGSDGTGGGSDGTGVHPTTVSRTPGTTAVLMPTL